MSDIQSSSAHAVTRITGSGDAPTAIDGFEPAVLEKLRALDPEGRSGLFQRVLTTFESSTRILLDDARQAALRGDGDTLRRLCHTLRSSSATMGAKSLSVCCGELERSLIEVGGCDGAGRRAHAATG